MPTQQPIPPKPSQTSKPPAPSGNAKTHDGKKPAIIKDYASI